MSGLKYWLWLTTRKGMDAVGALAVLDHFVTPQRAYYADVEEYEHLPLRGILRQGLQDKSLAAAEKILEDCQRLDLRIMSVQDADYPERLRQIADPPPVLYLRGRSFHFDEEVAIGVVGSRTPSEYGKMAAAKLGLELADGGALVVSGIAEGVDACALQGALKAGGAGASVLAGGVDMPFPPRHRYLYEDVAAAGILISEYPPGTAHLGHHFLQRNRILSGLTLGVLAVECRPFGGTMSSINHALSQDRDVFAVPGAIDAPMSDGTNRLIQQGAKLVSCGRDILEEYWDRFPAKLNQAQPISPAVAQARLEGKQGWTQSKRTPAPKLEQPKPTEKAREIVPRKDQKRRFTDDELLILATLAKQSRSADEVVELTQIPTRRVLSALTMLQVQGAVEEQGGRRFFARLELEQ